MNQTINVSLSKNLLDFARAQVKKGYFSSVSEVIRSALREFARSYRLEFELEDREDPLVSWRSKYGKEFSKLKSEDVIRKMRDKRWSL